MSAEEGNLSAEEGQPLSAEEGQPSDADRRAALSILLEMSASASAGARATMSVQPDIDEGFGALATYALAAQLGANAARDGHDAGAEPRRSTMPLAGQGLFATQRWPRGACICCYRGTVLRTRDAIRLKDKSYLMRLGPQVYVDARPHPHVLARYINDARNPTRNNARFEKLPEQVMARVLATRDIEPGEEVLVDYGRWYWLGVAKDECDSLPS